MSVSSGSAPRTWGCEMDELTAVLSGIDANVPVYSGYAPTGARAPYLVVRPLYLESAGDALSGDSVGWSDQTSVYAVAASVTASGNLARAVVRETHGLYVGGSALSATANYAGVQIEGQYESQVTITRTRGIL